MSSVVRNSEKLLFLCFLVDGYWSRLLQIVSLVSGDTIGISSWAYEYDLQVLNCNKFTISLVVHLDGQ